MTDDTGTVVTADGRIDPADLGVTLPHEHLFADWSEKFTPPDDPERAALARDPVSLETLWSVRRDPAAHLDNLRLDSREDAADELAEFRRAGGDAIVDVTPKNVGGDPEAARAVAREAGVTLVCGTAFYYRDAHPPRVDDMTVADIAAEFASDVRHGIDGTDVRAGIIGELGTSTTDDRAGMHEAEERVLRAGARAALETGASISVHPPAQRDPGYPPSRHGHDILDVAEAEGLPPERVVVCHMDQSKHADGDMASQLELADRGAYVEFDLFGHDRFVFGTGDAQPSDPDRVEYVREFVEAGHADRLLLSQDVFLKHRLKTYGGDGYSYLLETVRPMLRERGLDRATVERLLVDNPREVLTFAAPR